MTVHFAAARTVERSAIARALVVRKGLQASNDNGPGFAQDKLLHAALRHFADHGLSAARVARKQAEDAFFAGDREAYDWWLQICRSLDRRLASELDTRHLA